MKRQRILAVVGTRPEAIKMAPVILRLKQEPDRFETVVCATAQHRDMLDSVLQLFNITPDVDLNVMRPGQSPNGVAAQVFDAFDEVLEERRPDWVVVQGDTTTVMASSIASFHRGVRVAHVEAGLRTNDLHNPFPEEMNRRVCDLIADIHFAPTERNARQLLAERLPPERIHVTGNTVVDALHSIAALEPPPDRRNLILITAHRRENFGAPMVRAFRAVRRLAERFPETTVVFPVHRNPRVREAADTLRGVGNILLEEPADYRVLVGWLRSARLVITDSGGIQEEAPAFGTPTLVLRTSTERPEGVEAGIARLVGTDEDTIFREAERLLTDESAHAAMAQACNPYGDGRAAERIVSILAGEPVPPFIPAFRQTP